MTMRLMIMTAFLLHLATTNRDTKQAMRRVNPTKTATALGSTLTLDSWKMLAE